MNSILITLLALLSLNTIVLFLLWRRQLLFQSNDSKQQQQLITQYRSLETQLITQSQTQKQLYEHITQLLSNMQKSYQEQQSQFQQYQINSLTSQQQSLEKGMQAIRAELVTTLNQNTKHSNEQLTQLTHVVSQRLQDISQQVEKRLADGFEKTTTLFTDVVKRLAIIDAAQQRITELSNNVVSLQDILRDKRARGAFGEVQLAALVRNTLPEEHIKLQHTLSNGKRVDCLLILPEPTGNIAIDAKFPLETYQKMYQSSDNTPLETKPLQQQFRQDIRKHIQDIANKYCIPGETADGAILFIPAESVFAEIHAHYPDVVEYAQKCKVWITSPTTMMAILTTALAVLKDVATRKQVNIIQEHLSILGKDFMRFQKRMDSLAKHIGQAHSDVEQVHISSQKISQRFHKIEQVELEEHPEIEAITET